MSFKIEKDVPFKNTQGGKKYPIDEMIIGDSFLVPCPDPQRHRVQNSMGATCRGYTRYHSLDWRFSVKQVDGGVRVFRIG